MKKILCLLLLASLLHGADNIIIHNRILAKINSQPISVIDVTKKMDFIFYREFQAYAHSDEARAEFYATNWRSFLDDMIDEQLILASAKEMKVTVSDGEVRQEMEETLGPNIIAKIDQMGLTYPEVFKMMQNDLLVRRMVYSMVHAKASAMITPARVKEAYEKYAMENPLEESWNYRVVTIRSSAELGAIAACQMLCKMVDQDKMSLAEVKESLQISDVQISLSEELHRTAKTLSESHKTGLAGLKDNEHSAPLNASTKEGETVYRLFFLTEYKPAGKVSFLTVEEKLKGALLQDAIAAESLAWRTKLRERYGIDAEYLALMVPTSFQPYGLKP